MLLEIAVGARGRVAAVERDRLAGELARHAGLVPGGDIVLGAAAARPREDRVELRQRQALDRVVLVDEDRQGIDRDAQLGRLVAELLLELVDLGALHRPRHRAELGGAVDQRRRRRRRALALDLDLDAGIGLAEVLGPERHQVVERVGADRLEIARDAADLGVGRQPRIDLLGGGRRRGDENGGGREKRVAEHGVISSRGGGAGRPAAVAPP